MFTFILEKDKIHMLSLLDMYIQMQGPYMGSWPCMY